MSVYEHERSFCRVSGLESLDFRNEPVRYVQIAAADANLSRIELKLEMKRN